jgi:hypothetical protein
MAGSATAGSAVGGKCDGGKCDGVGFWLVAAVAMFARLLGKKFPAA